MTNKWIVTAVAAVLCIAGLAASVGAVHARLYGHDIFFLLDNGWRAWHGQRVHVDYVSAYGPVTFLLIAAGLALSGGSVAAVTYASALFAATAGLWSVWLVGRRSHRLVAVLWPCFVALLAAAPFALGDPPTLTSQAMVYNRYGDVLLVLLMLECFVPPIGNPEAPRLKWLEPALTGCALGLLLFLKISIFLVALPLIGMSLLFGADRSLRISAHALGFAITSLAFLAYLRFDARAMLADLQMAAAARSGTLGIGRDATQLLTQGTLRAAPLAASAILCCRWIGKVARAPSLWRGWCYPLTAVLVVVADTLLLLTNAQVLSYPLTAGYSLVLLLSLPPVLGSPAGVRKASMLLIAAASLLALPMFFMHVWGLGFALIESKANPNPPGILRFESPRLHSLVLYDISPDDMDRYSNGREYVSSINDGIRLLTAHTTESDKITTLDMANPFPFALGRAPVQGGIALGAYGFTINEFHHPSTVRYFADSAVVMVPKFPALAPIFYDGYFKIYEPALRSEFRLEAESERWWLYRRAGGVPVWLRQ